MSAAASLHHSCVRKHGTCTRCRACDATRTRRTITPPAGQSYVVRICSHCDGEVAHRLTTKRSQ